MIAFSVQIEPHVVLDVTPEATLQEIRDAYRRQAKKHHPDTGGTDWAFRIVSQAYEVLSTARLELASRRVTESEMRSRSPRTAPTAAQNEPEGATNPSVDPKRRVGVEKLWVRYESEPLWLIQDPMRDEHSLSCSLNFKWPDPSCERVPVETAELERILNQLAGVFEAMCGKTTVDTSRIRINDDSFTGWLSYSSGEKAAAAYQLLQGMLTNEGFAVQKWDRDLLIPHTWL
ncbi:J domain-containing protein [Singulisphaera acidiphila]|uniref:DnaJ-class molecular chaperone with C-terminal Zn finger domain n=1 Tax=Singulisphaera acidiphila (strain ATCC BAA-1392 / DSM 18658 / VKM B-2454 / MOB10) TaxID=886293 RepID=L0DM86_SINAD|nr:J domain-containing protein [Singulisphaera acidiphila]AGA30494.1 DnaJ-class molecular chaperone with C-terminal Zn finger domain [Singulisphaera acidiphila DSM 18658]